jgi:predicted nucleotidyltransferase
VSRDWEATFSSWGAAPGVTERTKCENAERAVRKAIDANAKLSGKSIEVFVQGSYANRTNVRQDSDVDICVLYTDAFFPDYSLSAGLSNAVLRFGDGTYRYEDFKNDVGSALSSYFDAGSVSRGNKAFAVHANSYRIDADVVPCFEHRRYLGTAASHHYDSGTEMHPDNGGVIVNWPKQNYANGVSKNEATGRRFKAVTRILKRLRNEMAEQGAAVAEPIASYLIECLVWNVPNEYFGQTSYRKDVRSALAHIWGATKEEAKCNEWVEVNERKYLLRGGQAWTRQQVHKFIDGAWDYVGVDVRGV